jgi:hypothetical protein
MMIIYNSGGIKIDTDQEEDGNGIGIYNHFLGAVLSDHAQIGQLQTGRLLLERLKVLLKRNRTLTIAENQKVALIRTRRIGLHGGESLETQTKNALAAREKLAAETRSDGTTESNDSKGRIAKLGVPVDGVIVTYDPLNANYANNDYENPTWIVLAHELIHALHYLDGTRGEGSTDHKGKSVLNEELRTVGLGKFANEAICENQLRKEAMLTARLQY